MCNVSRPLDCLIQFHHCYSWFLGSDEGTVQLYIIYIWCPCRQITGFKSCTVPCMSASTRGDCVACFSIDKRSLNWLLGNVGPKFSLESEPSIEDPIRYYIEITNLERWGRKFFYKYKFFSVNVKMIHAMSQSDPTIIICHLGIAKLSGSTMSDWIILENADLPVCHPSTCS